jgi:4-amino-4-deoxy-L-arabinose transferase-like glycosyltransferase
MTSSARRIWAPIGIVMLVAIALRVWVLPLDWGPDESVYMQSAWNLSRGTLDLTDSSWYVHRLPVYLPAAALYRLFGLGLVTTVVWPLLASLVQALLAVLLASRIEGTRAGLLAGLFLALLPLDIVSSAHLLPDGIFGALMSASVVSWWFADSASGPVRRSFLAALAGVGVGVAVLVRPYAGILLLFFAGDATVLRGGRIRQLLPLVAGLALPLAAYLAAYGLVVGDPLYRLEIVSRTYSSGVLAEPARWLLYPRVLVDPRGPFGVQGLLLLATAPFLLRQPRRDVIRVFAWALLIGAFLEFGSMSLDSYLPILKRDRFLTPLSLPLCVLLGIASARALDRLMARISGSGERSDPARTRGALTLAGLILVFVVEFPFLRNVIDTQRARRHAFQAVAMKVEERDDLPLFVDHWRTAIRLAPHVRFFGGRGFYFGGLDADRMSPGNYDSAGRLWYLEPDSSPEHAPSGLVLLDRVEHRGPPAWYDPDPTQTPTPLGVDEVLFTGAGVELLRIGPARVDPGN